MLIYRINNNSHKRHLDNETKTELSKYGIDIADIDASSMSFITSMRIATDCKKATPDLVIVDCNKNAIAAISARVLTRKRGQEFAIAMRVTNNDRVPSAIPKEIRNEVDTWLFDDEKTQTDWKGITSHEKCHVIGQPLHVLHVEQPDESNTLIYAGSLDKCECLSSFITALANLEAEQRPTVRVCGTGKARYVMPVVKRARAMGLDIEWLGDNYNIDDEIKNAAGFIVSDYPYSPNEIRALAAGLPPVTAKNLHEWLDTNQRKEMAKKAKETYLNNHDPKSVAQRLKEIINIYTK